LRHLLFRLVFGHPSGLAIRVDWLSAWTGCPSGLAVCAGRRRSVCFPAACVACLLPRLISGRLRGLPVAPLVFRPPAWPAWFPAAEWSFRCVAWLLRGVAAREPSARRALLGAATRCPA